MSEVLPGFRGEAWMGLLAPAKTPPEIVQRMSQEVAKAVAAPDSQKRLADLGAEPRSSTPDEMRAHVASEIAKWRRVVDDAGDVVGARHVAPSHHRVAPTRGFGRHVAPFRAFIELAPAEAQLGFRDRLVAMQSQRSEEHTSELQSH